MYNFTALVIKGLGRGKKIGFPTINLNKIDLNLEHGVYLINANIKEKPYKGLMHFGPKTTFNEGISAEVYIKNFNKNIYGAEVEVSVVKKIRDIQKFNSAEDLTEQIKKDLKFIV